MLITIISHVLVSKLCTFKKDKIYDYVVIYKLRIVIVTIVIYYGNVYMIFYGAKKIKYIFKNRTAEYTIVHISHEQLNVDYLICKCFHIDKNSRLSIEIVLNNLLTIYEKYTYNV